MTFGGDGQGGARNRVLCR